MATESTTAFIVKLMRSVVCVVCAIRRLRQLWLVLCCWAFWSPMSCPFVLAPVFFVDNNTGSRRCQSNRRLTISPHQTDNAVYPLWHPQDTTIPVSIP